MEIEEKDLTYLRSMGITKDSLDRQVAYLENGVPYLKLVSAAVPASGVFQVPQDQLDSLAETWMSYTQTEHGIVKFVPASGAASRMFKDLFQFLEAPYDRPQTDSEMTFFNGLSRFAFHKDLEEACRNKYGKGISELLEEGSFKQVAHALLDKDGLGYGNMAKGLLLFHKTDTQAPRTPLEEHMVEGALYAASRSGKVRIHFTVSERFDEAFKKLAKSKAMTFARRYGVEYEVTFSHQNPSTDTVSLDHQGQLVRDSEGEILLRPAGHGALLENLNALDADIIFVKNIDNVVPDRIKGDGILYKKVLAGFLVTLQQRIFTYLKILDSGHYTHAQLADMERFLEEELLCTHPQSHLLEDSERAVYIKDRLNRPLRVCGMVPRSGEVGGAPYMAVGPDGTISPQILEPSQIDLSDPVSAGIALDGTHFNPVDLVLAVRDYKGEKFDLMRYVDPATCFVSEKTLNGKPIRVLERPGLWNGAMSQWNTVFVEVPLSTFNPVKTVNDLLRVQHQ